MGLDRDGPGLLLRDILKGDDPQVAAVASVIAATTPDIIVLQNVDYDHGLAALSALRDAIAAGGPHYPHLFALRPNTGMPTGHDLDADGRTGGARDRQGYGAFSGQGGMAILSRHPFRPDRARDLSGLLWKDLPGALLPTRDGAAYPSAAAFDVLRLASVAHWAVPVALPEGDLHLLAFHASPPVFDGPEDFNGRRNHDQLRFWRLYLDGEFGPRPARSFVLLGDANLDPADGEGRRAAIHALLSDPRLQDPQPMRPGPVPTDPGQVGDPRLDTVAWPRPDPGEKRVDYILPSADLTVTGAGIHWPPPGTSGAEAVETASRHRLVWVDISIP